MAKPNCRRKSGEQSEPNHAFPAEEAPPKEEKKCGIPQSIILCTINSMEIEQVGKSAPRGNDYYSIGPTNTW